MRQLLVEELRINSLYVVDSICLSFSYLTFFIFLNCYL